MLYIPYPFKRCTKCGREYLPTTRFFNKRPTRKFGLESECKTCHAERGRKNRQKDPERHREYVRKYRAKDPDHVNELARRRRAENPERSRLRSKRFYYRHRESELARRKLHGKIHPEQIRAASRRRRARKAHAAGNHIYADELAQLKRQKHRCYYCQEKIKGNQWHPDHVIPLSRGGSDGPDNIVIACPRCNMRKHDKLPHEWTEGGRLL